jgi:hypothetical protein
MADQPQPVTTPKSAVGERDTRIGPWRVWFDPPPIGTRNCDWHYQHDDAEPECPAWMHGHCASRDACIVEIIDTYEERLP